MSLISVCVSIQNSRQQRNHNNLSIRPVPEVTVADYEHSIRVKLRNFGNGPLTVKRLYARRGGTTVGALIDLMPNDMPEKHSWTHFSHELVDRAIRVNGEIILLQLDKDPTAARFDYTRDRVRYCLHDIAVTVEYTDIQGSDLPPYSKSLEWFGRNLDKDSEGKPLTPSS